jgi:hypothetical protein
LFRSRTEALLGPPPPVPDTPPVPIEPIVPAVLPEPPLEPLVALLEQARLAASTTAPKAAHVFRSVPANVMVSR